MVEASPRFQPVHLIADPELGPAAPSDLTPRQDGKIEIEMRSGVRVRVGHGADLKVLRGVLTILDGR